MKWMQSIHIKDLTDWANLAFELWKAGAVVRHDVTQSFDAQEYLAANPDVDKSKMQPLLHYLRFGRHEGRPLRVSNHPATDASLPQDILTYQFAKLQPHFDSSYYQTRYQDLNGTLIGPLEHFVLHGAKEGRNPSATFDTKAYRTRYPEIASFGDNPFFHYLVVGRSKGYEPGLFGATDPEVKCISNRIGVEAATLLTRHRDAKGSISERLKTGELGRMFDKAVAIDPLVGHARLAVMECGVSPLRDKPRALRLSAMIKLQEAAGYRPAKAIILIPWNHLGGASKLAGHLTKALATELSADEVLVIHTENDEWDYPQWFPLNTRRVDFSGPTKNLEARDKLHVLLEFLRSLDADVIVNVNSPKFWPLIENFGRQLRAQSRLFTYFFCNEKNVLGEWGGYPVRNFHHQFDHVDGFLVDSHAMKEELSDRFGLSVGPKSKILVLDTPIGEALPQFASAPERSAGTRPVVFWAGRFDRQKRVDVVYAIARELPNVDFRLWGEMKLDRSLARLEAPDNVRNMGTYKSLLEVGLSEADLWLYTSEWDGVPNVLIEIATTGIPIVGSISGGTGEILDLGFSHPVRSVDDIAGFVAAIKTVLADPDSARADAAKLREAVLKSRDPESYRASLMSALRIGKENE
jgi:glycosyltransferase involved in cell wall biosynthesis